MNHNEALAKLAQLEQEIKELRAILEKPERAPSLLSVPKPGSRDPFWFLHSKPGNLEIAPVEGMALTASADFYAVGNVFQSEELAQAYAEAIDTMLLLRHQPGTDGDNLEWTIAPLDSTCSFLVANNGLNKRVTFMFSVPMFDSSKNAELAIATIGEERIIRMFKVLHGVDD